MRRCRVRLAGYAIHDGEQPNGKKHILRCPTRIRGKVQGVGIRPLARQLAQQLNLHGDVCNDGDG
ncbi:acylphosphatase [Escherichia coli]